MSSLRGVGQREGGGNQGKWRGRKRRVKTERKGGMFSELRSIMFPSVSHETCSFMKEDTILALFDIRHSVNTR